MFFLYLKDFHFIYILIQWRIIILLHFINFEMHILNRKTFFKKLIFRITFHSLKTLCSFCLITTCSALGAKWKKMNLRLCSLNFKYVYNSSKKNVINLNGVFHSDLKNSINNYELEYKHPLLDMKICTITKVSHT